MQRYMVTESLADFKGTTTELSGEHFHHIKKVMRSKVGTKVYLTDPNRHSFVAEIVSFTDQTVLLKWVSNEERNSELPVEVTIASGLTKGDKQELIIQKATELGANQIITFASNYSVVKWDSKKVAKKITRFQRIAQEAAEQSHRQQVPVVDHFNDLKTLLDSSKNYTHKLVAYEEESKVGEKSRFADTLTKVKSGESLLIVFGPEGGLSPNEITQLQAEGFVTCGLGPRILRAETAPLYALAAISYQFELLN